MVSFVRVQSARQLYRFQAKAVEILHVGLNRPFCPARLLSSTQVALSTIHMSSLLDLFSFRRAWSRLVDMHEVRPGGRVS